MKEVKTFFTSDNRLNKGYANRKVATSQPDSVHNRNKLKEILPDPDVLALYEEMHPGDFEKLVSMLHNEQKHRHLMHEVHAKMESKACLMGRIFGLFVICVIGYVTLELSKVGMINEGLIFSGIAFAGIFGASIIASKCSKVEMQTCEAPETECAPVEQETLRPVSSNKPNKNYKQNRRHNRRK